MLHPLLQPYRPTPADPFDRTKAAHLYSRAGFGATRAEIDRAVSAGLDATLDAFFSFPDLPAEEQGNDVPDLSAIENYPADFRELKKLFEGRNDEQKKEIRQKLQMANRQAVQETAWWWLNRMAAGPHPLQEKLTLFWHGHFTTSARDERIALLMWKQNELLRQHAAGNFGQFVRAISRDPAMLDYLNNQQNRKAKPNENYARELMELFTLGIGHYTEADVKEAARAFTGWGHDGDEFVFRKSEHDFGPKTFLGRTGRLDGDDIIAIILQQRPCGEFIGQKLFEFFVQERANEGIVKNLGELLRESNYQLRPLIRTILSSRAFFSTSAMGSHIKSPIHLVVGTSRLLGMKVPKEKRLNALMAQMGQVPFMPPNVKGWPGGRSWINTSTLFARQNAALWLAGQWKYEPFPGATTPQQRVDAWLSRLVHVPIDAERRNDIVSAITERKEEAATRHALELILTLPEYQLC